MLLPGFIDKRFDGIDGDSEIVVEHHQVRELSSGSFLSIRSS
jgi:hypothetical protein